MQIAYQHANDSVPTPSVEEPGVPGRARRARAVGDRARPRRAPARRPRDARPAARDRARAPASPPQIAAHRSATMVHPRRARRRPTRPTAETTVLARGVDRHPPPPRGRGVRQRDGRTRGAAHEAPTVASGADTGLRPRAAARRPRRRHRLVLRRRPRRARDRARCRATALRRGASRCSRPRASWSSTQRAERPRRRRRARSSGTDPAAGEQASTRARASRCSSRSARSRWPCPTLIGHARGRRARPPSGRLHGGRAERPAVLRRRRRRHRSSPSLGADGDAVAAAPSTPSSATVTLVVSVGAVPMSPARPSATPRGRSRASDLAVDRRASEFSDDVPIGPRRSCATPGDAIRCGPATRSCSRVSKGPDLVEVPERHHRPDASAQAREQLEALGFTCRRTSRLPRGCRRGVGAEPGGRRDAEARLRGHRQLRLSRHADASRASAAHASSAVRDQRRGASVTGHPRVGVSRLSSSSATRNASSSDCMWFRRGSQSDS